MLITIEEYYAMGFSAADDAAAESCIKRAGYIIASLTDGRAADAIECGGNAAELVKQAVGFQAQQLAEEEIDPAATEESVTLGDFSYRQKASDAEKSCNSDEYKQRITGLLRAAGVMFKGVTVRGY